MHMDVKFPLDNFLRVREASTDAERATFTKAFLKDVRQRVKEISTRSYAESDETLDSVLLFIPNEGIYSFIHEHDTQLVDVALSQNVVLCSPFTLFSVLAVIRQAVDAFLVERTSDHILECLAGFGAQWGKFSDAVDLARAPVREHTEGLRRSGRCPPAPVAEAPRSRRLAPRGARPRAAARNGRRARCGAAAGTRRPRSGRRGSPGPARRLGPLTWPSTLGGFDMGRHRVRHTLDDHPLFADVTRRERRAYARHAEPVRLAPGTVLLREGREPMQVTYLRTGRAEVSRFGAPLGEIGPGQAIGAEVLARLEVSDVTVTAVTPVDAVVLHRRAFRGAWRALPALRSRIEGGRDRRLAPVGPSR